MIDIVSKMLHKLLSGPSIYIKEEPGDLTLSLWHDAGFSHWALTYQVFPGYIYIYRHNPRDDCRIELADPGLQSKVKKIFREAWGETANAKAMY